MAKCLADIFNAVSWDWGKCQGQDNNSKKNGGKIKIDAVRIAQFNERFVFEMFIPRSWNTFFSRVFLNIFAAILASDWNVFAIL